MALTHVKTWNNGWKDITIDEAIRKHPGGTVSAKSGLFMCDLCKQYVTLTNEIVNARHFRHETNNPKSRSCPDKTDSYSIPSYIFSFAAKLVYPIKIEIADSKVTFKVGFNHLSFLNRSGLITINPVYSFSASNKKAFQFSVSRLSNDGITYLPVGEIPAKEYNLSINQGEVPIQYLPKSIPGITESYTLFSFEKGKMIPYGADVSSNRFYYLLTNRYFRNYYYGVTCNTVCVLDNNWYLYKVCADSFDEDAARFFLDLGYVLTQNPVKVFPLWGAYTRSRYIIHHESKKLYYFIRGEDFDNKVFPSTSYRTESINSKSRIVYFTSQDRQQLLTVGRNESVLDSLYIHVDKFDYKHYVPKIKVCDIDGNNIDKDYYQVLPKAKSLQIQIPFYGKLRIFEDGMLVDLVELEADTLFELNDIKLGQKIEIIIGLDTFRTIFFEASEKRSTYIGDKDLLIKLMNCHGEKTKAYTEVRSLLLTLSKDSIVRKWAYKQLKAHTLTESAFKLLKDAVRGYL